MPDDTKRARSSIRKGTPLQNAKLFCITVAFENTASAWYEKDPDQWECVQFFNHLNKRTHGCVVEVHEAANGEDFALFDIQVSMPGQRGLSQHYQRVRRSRILRRKKYMGCNQKWRQLAAIVSGYSFAEVESSTCPPPSMR